MLKVVKANEYLSKLKDRSFSNYLNKQSEVNKIINEVISEGDNALIRYAKDFDFINVGNFSLKVSESEKDSGLSSLSSDIKDIISEAYKNITNYHQRQKENSYYFNDNGAFLGQMVNPIEKVGAYVPGGLGIYPSSVLMNCIPAQIAGVPEIYIATPPNKDGLIDPSIIFSAMLCGVKDIFKVGGAGAIAAFAYGTRTIPKVYKIVGPGNLYVTTAKKMVYGDVDIDMIAGPSEIMILADELANIDYLTYDMFSQSEHSIDASSIVLLPDEGFANELINNISDKLEHSKRKHTLKQSLLSNGVIVIYSSLSEAYDVINEYAPEHLEVLVDIDFTTITNNIKNVGSIFLGNYTPEPVGDYFAGSNHSLPTGGTAKFFSPLGVYDFQKKTSIIRYSKERLKRDQKKIITLSEYEQFFEHANSVRARQLG